MLKSFRIEAPREPRHVSGRIFEFQIANLTSKSVNSQVFVKPALILSVVFLIAARSQGEDQAAFFESRVRPLLLKKCGECHGKEDPEGKLTLTSVEGIAAGGASGPTVVPERLDQSRLIQAVRYTAKLKMPPDTKLLAEEIAILEKWVRDGAALPGANIEARKGSLSGEFTITDEDRNWWAFRAVRNPVPPPVEARARVLKPVDRFVLRRLEEKGLTLSAPADRQTILRRITFDLTGLPPTLAEIDAFLNDDSPDAYERLVERLLASPGYGVRWGRHWLDVARYADTNGGGFDYVYPNAWRYRDYVVRSFNADKPYDQFLVEQLAGDLLSVEPNCSEDEYVDRLTATGLLTLAPKGLGMQDKEQMVLDVVDDQIDVLGRSLIGLTLSCARCHDHKFDPISTRDYYALAGIFRSTTSLTRATSKSGRTATVMRWLSLCPTPVTRPMTTIWLDAGHASSARRTVCPTSTPSADATSSPESVPSPSAMSCAAKPHHLFFTLPAASASANCYISPCSESLSSTNDNRSSGGNTGTFTTLYRKAL